MGRAAKLAALKLRVSRVGRGAGAPGKPKKIREALGAGAEQEEPFALVLSQLLKPAALARKKPDP